MRITTKGRYGLRIMLDIARAGGSEPVRVNEIAARQDITVKYIEQIMGLLSKGGMLRSVRGASGGYALVKSPQEYTVGEILRCAEGNLLPVSCAESDYPCDRAESCGVRSLWEGFFTLTNDYFDSVSLADLLEDVPARDLLGKCAKTLDKRIERE